MTSRIRSTVDTGRVSAGLSRPGIDPRLWLSYATVLELGVDPAEGVYADVQLLPTGEKETVLVGAAYAGPGYGAWAPLAAGDLVLVAAPRGDFNLGAVLVARLWGGADPPPPELGATQGADPPTDPVVVVGPGQTLKVICRPGGSVEVTGDVPNPLGPGVNPVSLSVPTDNNFERFKAAIQGWTPVPLDGGAALKLALELLFIGASPPAPAPPVPPIPDGTPTPNPPWPEATGARVLKGD